MIDREVIDKKNELLLALRREMNGAVAGAMRDGGIEYGLNLGVSVTTVRSIATRFAPDDELARRAWGSGVRELRLAALFIAPAEALADVERWRSGVETLELAENWIWALSRHEEFIKEVFGVLRMSYDLLDRYMVLLALARRPQLMDLNDAEELCRKELLASEPMIRRAADNLSIVLGIE